LYLPENVGIKMIIEMTLRNLQAIHKSNQPFDVIGRIVPMFADGAWSFSECLYVDSYEKSYPNEERQWEDYIDNPDRVVFLYYNNGECVGQVILRKNWNNYVLIEYMAVSKNHRGKGIGKQLMQKSVEWVKSKNFPGLMVETQDINLQACRFYSKMGFQIGAVDTMLYANFNKSDEKAIFWYMKF